MNIHWIAIAMFFCGLLGYRVAVDNRLTGVTGVVAGLAVSGLVAADGWRLLLQTVSGQGLVTSLVGAGITLAGVVFAAQKLKLLAYLKLIGWLVPFALASIEVPRYALNGEPVVDPAPQAQAERLAPGSLDAAREADTGVIAARTPLYRDVNGTFVKLSVVLRAGAVVEIDRQTGTRRGGRWVAVTLVRRDRSFSGFVPVETLR